MKGCTEEPAAAPSSPDAACLVARSTPCFSLGEPGAALHAVAAVAQPPILRLPGRALRVQLAGEALAELLPHGPAASGEGRAALDWAAAAAEALLQLLPPRKEHPGAGDLSAAFPPLHALCVAVWAAAPLGSCRAENECEAEGGGAGRVRAALGELGLEQLGQQPHVSGIVGEALRRWGGASLALQRTGPPAWDPARFLLE